MTIIWCMVPDIWSMTQSFLSWQTIFCIFTTLTTRENQNFEIMKKTPWDIIILHMCNINENHRTYGSWDMEPNRHYTLSIEAIFCPFTPLTTWKAKSFKKWKKQLEILQQQHFTFVYHKWQSWCMVPEISNATEFFVILDYFLRFYPLN